MTASHPLIILRGNSGCGKTSTARLLQHQLGYGTMLVSQDVVRREILRVKDNESNPAIQLIYDLCMYGNNVGYTVILEGILSNKKYGAMLRRLLDDFQGEKLIYYFDVSFEETVRRHATKLNAHEFGELEMRQWWKDQDVLNVPGEQRIDEQLSQAGIVDLIRRDVFILSEGANASAPRM
ncbi:kinase [Candidatus Nanosynbacter sp. HMT-352]|uniref:kinase n=1 Tax=Candidatus Nanosynbacter sp. HMT-352 TaxID=2899133 RepID=UPI001FB77F51|nr:kinase [Candidatus Nanosynbacter sp. HMT-352]UOG67196.1 kinase [Candidatus Nanosynbacter sp. HMT-352]